MARTVTLVDEQGSPTGTLDLIDAHTGTGSLHKAFSVYVFRSSGSEILIQQRSQEKMLWPGIWANTCCSHPFENEGAIAAGQRRLQEEMGFSCDLKESDTLVYRAEDPFGKGVEHEHVTLLRGDVDGNLVPVANPSEVADWKWIAVDALQKDMQDHPDQYAPWFHLGLRQLLHAQ